MATSTSALARRASALCPRGAAAPARVLIPTSRSVGEGHAQAPGLHKFSSQCNMEVPPWRRERRAILQLFLLLHVLVGARRVTPTVRPPPLSKGGRGSLFSWGGRAPGARRPDRYSGLSAPSVSICSLRTSSET